MTAYLLRRLLLAIPTLAGIVLAVFLLMRIAPGDPASAAGRLAHRRFSRAAAEAMRRTYGLDRPLPAQIADWFGRAARLDFGNSFQDHRPVASRIAEALPYTLALNALALFLALAIAVPLGVAQARRAGSRFDRVSARVVFLLYSTPSFWMAMILITVFSVRLEWLPLFGVASDPAPAGWGAALLDRLAHLALPLACLTYGTLAFLTRLVRSSVREELSREYVLAARARGLSESRALWRHAFRNALLPLVTVMGLVLPGLLSGSVIVEQIFAWPGLGRLYFDAVLARDYPVVLGLTFVTAVATLAATFAADLLYAVVDPRVRYG
ncbi:MAG TPA: ABC transporter permease [Thermoanaerobaculia bacterium]|nr:ABC transporter permease [Thermoanaerobaculia bacterium]